MTFDEGQLAKAVNHLAFDVYHFRCYTRLYREGRLTTCAPTAAQAVIYSLLLHLRLLLDFFYGPPKLDDCWVGHFSVLPGFTASFGAPSGAPTRDDARTLSGNLHKRLAHLTATRWEKEAPPMNYYNTYLDGIDHLLTTFEAALPKNVRQVFANGLRDWERKHPAAI
jgi:hypothetical protein